jgi:hypothetical protein
MKLFMNCAASVAAILVVSGCANVDTTPNTTERHEEPEYRTGSRIPIHDKQPLTKEEQDKEAAEARRIIQQMQTTGPGIPKQ